MTMCKEGSPGRAENGCAPAQATSAPSFVVPSMLNATRLFLFPVDDATKASAEEVNCSDNRKAKSSVNFIDECQSDLLRNRNG